MRNKIIITSIIVVIILLSSFILFQPRTYSMLEIEADNYKEKLKENNQPIFSSNIDKCIPEFIPLLHSIDFAASNNFSGNGLEITREVKDKFIGVAISSHESKLEYRMWFDGKQPIHISIWENPMNYSEKLKEICDKLMLHGFVLKKTKLLKGNDILVKETDGNFIIVNINSNYEYPNPPMGLHIRTYKKAKSIL